MFDTRKSAAKVEKKEFSKARLFVMHVQDEPGSHQRLWEGRGYQDDTSRHVSRERQRPGQQHESGADPLQDSGPAVDDQRSDYGYDQTVSELKLLHFKAALIRVWFWVILCPWNEIISFFIIVALFPLILLPYWNHLIWSVLFCVILKFQYI